MNEREIFGELRTKDGYIKITDKETFEVAQGLLEILKRYTWLKINKSEKGTIKEEKAENLEPTIQLEQVAHIESSMKPELSKLSITKPVQPTEIEVKPSIEVISTEIEPEIDKEESAKTGERPYTKLKDCTPLGRTNVLTIYKEIVDRIAVLFEQGEPDSIKSIVEIIGDYYPRIKYKSLEVYSYDYLKYMREHGLMPKPEKVRTQDIGSVELKEPPKMPEGSEIPPELITLCSKLPDEFTWIDCRNGIEKIFGKSRLVSTTNSMIRLCKAYNLLIETEAGNFKKTESRDIKNRE